MSLDDEGGEWMYVYPCLIRFGGEIGCCIGISVNTGVVDVLLTLYKDLLSSDSNRKGPEGGILLIGLRKGVLVLNQSFCVEVVLSSLV